MKNEHFDKDMLSVILNSSKWKIISSLFPPEEEPVENQSYSEWAASSIDEHKHREILICLKGSHFYNFKGCNYKCEPGSVFFVDNLEPHAIGYPPDVPELTHLWLVFSSNRIVSNLYKVLNGRYCGIGNISFLLNSSDTVRTLNRCWKELAENQAEWMPLELKREKIASALSCALISILEMRLPEKEKRGSDYQHEVVETIKTHIEESQGYMESLEHLARIAGYSKFHFLRMFKEHTGQTVHAFINECRLKKVDEMLKAGCPKKSISYELGFSCPAAFRNWHKKYT